eukprot:TRINITY_DN1973_c1_g1_i4.p1 TRINITY_DN1973_c1_g1~~TRINITY_DN1973_c1_g1_i4.p1  ORF type:complete len:140 (+),score=42.06 TRINITY_DN1973_c1_g1_i4:450-869(+)
MGLGNDDSQTLKEVFENLADLINEYDAIKSECHFVLVPGPMDPGSADVVPHAPLPSVFTKKLSKVCNEITYATNPCRIRFYDQDILIYREDLVTKMRRNCLFELKENETEGLYKMAMKTVSGQGHLSPLPLEVRPVYGE